MYFFQLQTLRLQALRLVLRAANARLYFQPRSIRSVRAEQQKLDNNKDS